HTHSFHFSLLISFYSYRPLRNVPSFPTRRSSDLQVSAALVRDLPEALKINGSGIGTGSGDNQLWMVLHCQLLHLIVIDVALVIRSEEHTSELQSRFDLVCRLLLEKKKCELQCKRV